MAQALSLSYWGIFLQYHLAAVDVMKDNYYQHLQLPSRDEYPCHVKQWPTPTSEGVTEWGGKLSNGGWVKILSSKTPQELGVVERWWCGGLRLQFRSACSLVGCSSM